MIEGRTILSESGFQKAFYVLDHNNSRLGLTDDAKGSGEQIPLVILAKLLSGHGKWRARESSRDDIDALESSGIEVIEVRLKHTPLRPVQSQRGTGVLIDLHEPHMTEPGPLESESLSTSASAKFQDSRHIRIVRANLRQLQGRAKKTQVELSALGHIAAPARSSDRYWMASAMSAVEQVSRASRSAMVRAILSTRVYARADSPSESTARLSNAWASLGSG